MSRKPTLELCDLILFFIYQKVMNIFKSVKETDTLSDKVTPKDLDLAEHIETT